MMSRGRTTRVAKSWLLRSILPAFFIGAMLVDVFGMVSVLYQPAMVKSVQQAYRILGLRPGAKMEDVKAARRRKMKELHPDVTGDDGTLLKEVLQAVAIIEDPDQLELQATATASTYSPISAAQYHAPGAGNKDVHYGQVGTKPIWYRVMCTVNIREKPDADSVRTGGKLRANDVVEVTEVVPDGEQLYLKIKGKSPKMRGWIFTKGVAGRWENQVIAYRSFPQPTPQSMRYKANCNIRVRQYPDEDSATIRGIKEGDIIYVKGELAAESCYLSFLRKQMYLQLSDGGWIFRTGISGEWREKDIVDKVSSVRPGLSEMENAMKR